MWEKVRKMAVKDYAKMSAGAAEVRAYNKVKGWKQALDNCRVAKSSAEELGKKIEENSKKLKKLAETNRKFSGEFIRIAKIIAGQQSELTKAKKAKDKNQIVELEKKIAILDKDARKLGSQYTADASEGESLFNEIDLIYKALVKI
jgi:predicted RNase H-like nuclease (RuvC/YqgF family)